MRTTLAHFLLAALYLLPAGGAAAEEEWAAGYSVRHWGVEEGMPHNTASGAVQTDDGFLWIATDAGLVRFDGVAFQAPASPLFADAKASTIRAVIREDARTLLVANAKSDLLRVRDGRVSVYPLSVRMAPGQSVQKLFRERDGIFWISFSGSEAWRCSPGRVERFPAPGQRPREEATFAQTQDGEVDLCRGFGVERYVDGHLRVAPGLDLPSIAIAGSRRGGAWVAVGGHLFRLGGERLIPAGGPSWPAEYIPDVLTESHDGALWIGLANYGLLRWTPETASVVETFHSRINGLFEDDEGNVWVATEGGGLNRLRPRRFKLLANALDSPVEAASSVGEDTAGEMWFAGHANLKRSRGGAIESLSPDRGWPAVASWVCPDRAGNVWIGDGRSLFRARAGGAEPPVRIDAGLRSSLRAIFAASDGGVWLACEAGPLIRLAGGKVEDFGPAQGYTGTKAEALAEDAAGVLWVGTGTGGLFRFQGGRFFSEDVSALVRGNGIRAILVDSDGWRWIGTDGEGLLAQHGTASVRIGREQGLPDGVISQMLEDDFGFLWFGSRRGLFKIRRRELVECASGERSAVTPIVYGGDDGLSGLSAVGGHQPAAWKTQAGRLWFTTRKGFVTTDPAPEPFERRRPRVYLEEASADGRPLTESGGAPSSARRFAFRYTAPTFVATESVRFRFRLEGFDPDWSEATAQRLAVYSRLPPGSYRFRVAASDGEGSWSPTEAALAFAVVPAWWETAWMRAAELLAGGALLAGLVRYGSQRRLKRRLLRLEQDRRVTDERERIARNLHDGLGAGLTHVGMMAEQLAEDCDELGDMRRRASRLVDRVQAVARDLDGAVWAISPRHDRLPALCAYLCEYALEFFRDTPIRCRVELADDIPERVISPEARHHLFLAAKEALNNALKHANATQVALTMRRSGDGFMIEIADDGCGFEVAAVEGSTRNGLRNLRERINGAGGRLTVASSRAGTAVKIQLPCSSP